MFKIKRVKNTKTGDVFSVPVGDNSKRYIQYIVSDFYQLNSDVIRAFKKVYPADASPALSEIVNDEVDFYSHCATKAGIKLGFWECVGNIEDVGSFDQIFFRCTDDDGYGFVSHGWFVWKVGDEEPKSVGKLDDKTRKAEYGEVFQSKRIVDRLKTGFYSCVHPD
ncbi:hypothetical protein Barb7_00020 [Bacteroidales bacterium Barb7]|nr:hypothetical protein Barb7_00071 [Bacteroidales bacterium Barb7]OAV76284.1 hypothetical protein Barb7_00083 [Bacteroidales bacterium Barb7]OAV76306.1 hypothetical protein Barb7_00020 [Bacteroidales bacterium Barb7]